MDKPLDPGLLTLIVTGSVFLILLTVSRRLPREGTGRFLRNHLIEFSRAWLLLTFFYALSVFLPRVGYPANLEARPYDAAHLNYFLLFQLVVMGVCTATNLYLRRAILELDAGATLVDDGRQPHVLIAFLKPILSSLADEGILLSFLLSVVCVVAAMTDQLEAFAKLALVLAYSAQLGVSSALFFRLAGSYFAFKRSLVVACLATCYGLLQLGYPFFTFLASLSGSFPLFKVVLALAKITLAGAITAFCWRLASVAKNAHSTDPRVLLRKPAPVIDPSTTAVDKLGERLYAHSRLRVIVQVSRTVAILVAAGLLVGKPYLFSIHLASSLAPSINDVAWRSLWLIPAFLFVQTMVFLLVVKGSFRVRWRLHCNGLLKDLIELREHRQDFTPGWENLVFQSKERREHPGDGRPRVLLLHGIFSSGPQCWGLLPAILIESGGVEEVQLLTYKHSLWTRRKRLDQLLAELITIFEDLSAPTIVCAHSLGCLLTMKALSKLAAQNREDVLGKIQHAVFVAPPLTGSRYSLYGFPWPWPRLLRRNSPSVRKIVEAFAEEFPSEGYISGEEMARCTCSFFYGTRDGVAGADIKILSLPGRRVSVGAWHSAGAVYFKDSPLAKEYLAELEPVSRSLRLMNLLAVNLTGKKSPLFSQLFQLRDEGNLETALLWGQASLGWAKPFGDPLPAKPRGRLLKEAIQQAYQNESSQLSAGGTKLDWQSFWSELASTFAAAAPDRELIKMDWRGKGSLLVFSNREAGFMVVVNGHNHSAA